MEGPGVGTVRVLLPTRDLHVGDRADRLARDRVDRIGGDPSYTLQAQVHKLGAVDGHPGRVPDPRIRRKHVDVGAGERRSVENGDIARSVGDLVVRFSEGSSGGERGSDRTRVGSGGISGGGPTAEGDRDRPD